MIPQWRHLSNRKKAAAFALVMAVALASPPARSAIKAVALMLEVLPSPFRPLRALTPDPSMRTFALQGRQADLYEPRGLSRSPSLVLVHGAAAKGKDDPRLRELAVALSRSGRKVLVPDLGLKSQRLDLEDAPRIRAAITSAAGESKAGVIAFSYGAALCLAAITDQPEIQQKMSFVATVGTYFDLTHLIQGITTGTVPGADGQTSWTPHPRAKELLPEQFAEFLGGEEGRALHSAWERQDPAKLPAGARAAYELLANKDPSRVEELQAALPPHVRALLDRFSPAERVERLLVPVFALHSHNDPASPPSESRLLIEALKPRVEARLYEVSFLQHVDPTRSIFSNLREGFRIVRFAATILRSQEGWPSP